MQNNDRIEINVMGIIEVLLKKWYIIGISFVIGAILLFSVSNFLMSPKYTASAMIYIFSKTNEVTSMSEIQVGDSLAEDFIIIGKSRPVVEKVIRDLKLDMEYEEALSRIEFEQPTDSHVLKISMTDTNPKLATDVVNTLADITKQKISEIMGTDEPNTVEEAVVPKEPSSPNVMMNALLGAMIGAFIAIAVIVTRYLLDDTIKDENDVKKYLQLNVLAAVPLEKKMVNTRR